MSVCKYYRKKITKYPRYSPYTGKFIKYVEKISNISLKIILCGSLKKSFAVNVVIVSSAIELSIKIQPRIDCSASRLNNSSVLVCIV